MSSTDGTEDELLSWDDEDAALVGGEHRTLTALRERVAQLETQLIVEEAVRDAEKQRADAAESATVEAIAAWLSSKSECGFCPESEQLRRGDWKKR